MTRTFDDVPKVVLSFTLDLPARIAVKALAREQGNTISYTVRELVMEALAARGIAPVTAPATDNTSASKRVSRRSASRGKASDATAVA